MEKEITQRNEIISILNNMRLKHQVVFLKEKHHRFSLSGYITRADSNSVNLMFDKAPDIMPLNNLKICFDFNKNFYNSSETVVKIVNLPIKSIEFMVPDSLKFHAVRKFTRLDNVESIELLIKKVETGAAENKSNINVDELPATLRNIYMELEGEKPDLKKIISMIGEELNRYTNRFRINLFKDTEQLAPIEKVVNQYRKTFWIGDTDNLNNYVHLGDKYSIIGYEKYFEMIHKSMSPDILEQIRQNYVSRGISSYAMVPIIVGDRAVGVIEVSVPQDMKFKKLTIYEIFYIKGLSDILGEVVVKSQGSVSSLNASFKVLDLSLGGLLANTKNVYLTHSIKENTILTAELKAEEISLDIRARVVRYEYIPGENAGLNIAFEFVIDSDTQKLELSNLLKKFSKGISEKKS